MAIRFQKSLKLKEGDTIAICLVNCIEYPEIALGAMEAGLIITTVNPVYKPGKFSTSLRNFTGEIIRVQEI